MTTSDPENTPGGSGWGPPPDHQGWGDPGWGAGGGDPPLPSPGPVPVRPMGLGELLDAAFKLLRADFLPLLLAVGVVVVPTQFILSIINEALVFGSLETLEQNPEAFDLFLNDLLRGLPALIAVSVLQTLLLLLATAAVVRIGAARYLGSQEGAWDALRAAGRRFLTLLGAHLLLGLALLAALALSLVVVLIGLGLDQDAVMGIGLLLLLPALALMVHLYVLFALIVPPIMLEGAGAVASLRRSAQLVRGRWWPIFGILLVAFIVVGIVGSALGFIPSTIAGFFENQFVRSVISAIGASLTSLITQPVTALVVLLLYFDARIRKEGFDLELRNRAEQADVFRQPGFDQPGFVQQPHDPLGGPGGSSSG